VNRALRWYDYITINIYWFSLTTRAQTLTPLVLPLLVQRFVGEAAKGAYLGRIRLWALMVAVLTQALMGLLSDHSRARLGRRRPFILVGTLCELVVMTLIGIAAQSQEGMNGYWVLFALYVTSMLSSNTAHAATTGLIPDLVPEAKRGRFSGVKALFELPLPLVFVSLFVSRMITRGNIWGALITVMVSSVVCLILTMAVPEQPLEREPEPLNWEPLVRLVLMTAAFAAIILGMGQLAKMTTRLPLTMHAGLAHAILVVVALLTMAGAVLAGVWISVRISIGAEMRRHPSFVWWVVNRLAFLVGATNLSGFMLFFIQERFVELEGAKAAGPAALVMMAVGVLILLTAVPSGYLADRYGKKRLTLLAAVLATVGTAIVVLVPSMAAIYVGGGVAGIGIGLFYTSNWALGTEIVPAGEAGCYLGLANLAGAGAGAIGAYIGGPLADHTGYVLLFVVYGAMFAASALALGGIRERGTVRA
jgi:MFS family permease